MGNTSECLMHGKQNFLNFECDNQSINIIRSHHTKTDTAGSVCKSHKKGQVDQNYYILHRENQAFFFFRIKTYYFILLLFYYIIIL